VLALINHFNRISRWTSSRIVIERKVRSRARVMEHLIFIAKECMQLNSYHLLLAFISGFNASAILRLKWTRARLSKRAQQVLNELEAFTNMEASYKVYRNAIKTVEPPCIPYLGVYLQDLTFIEDGNPEMIDGKLINFTKRGMVFKILDQIITFQQVAYNLEAIPELQKYLSHLPQLTDADLYRFSMELEPRNATIKDIQ